MKDYSDAIGLYFTVGVLVWFLPTDFVPMIAKALVASACALLVVGLSLAQAD